MNVAIKKDNPHGYEIDEIKTVDIALGVVEFDIANVIGVSISGLESRIFNKKFPECIKDNNGEAVILFNDKAREFYGKVKQMQTDRANRQ